MTANRTPELIRCENPNAAHRPATSDSGSLVYVLLKCDALTPSWISQMTSCQDRRAHRAVGCIALLMSLSACSSIASGFRPAFYSAPPRGIIANPPAIAAGAPSATVIVYRDSTFAGSAIDRWIALGNKVVANMRPSQRVEFQVAPGPHEVSLHCVAARGWEQATVPIEALAGETYYLAMDSKGFRCGFLSRISSAAAAELNRTTKLIPTGP